jgi:hypothetical protein
MVEKTSRTEKNHYSTTRRNLAIGLKHFGKNQEIWHFSKKKETFSDKGSTRQSAILNPTISKGRQIRRSHQEKRILLAGIRSTTTEIARYFMATTSNQPASNNRQWRYLPSNPLQPFSPCPTPTNEPYATQEIRRHGAFFTCVACDGAEQLVEPPHGRTEKTLPLLALGTDQCTGFRLNGLRS